jgi:hypothetical protein
MYKYPFGIFLVIFTLQPNRTTAIRFERNGLPPEKRHENELESVTERRRTHASESIQRRADHRDIARA